MNARNRFAKGSGCFACCNCGRETRNVDGNGHLDMCPECYEAAGLENEISDCGDPDGSLQAELKESPELAMPNGDGSSSR